MQMECAGGAKDCGNFLAADSYGSYPLPSSLTHEGALYSHYFQIPPTQNDTLKCHFTTATTPDPISKKKDFFLSVGTASKYDGGGLRAAGGRPPVQLVFVLDVSGSMGGRFHTRDSKKMRRGGKVEKEKEEGSLLDAAKEALVGLLENMREGDSFGLVTFCTRAQTEVALEAWEGEKTREEVKEKVKEIKLRGATDLTCGFDEAIKEFDKEEFKDLSIIRRVFFLTDMCMTSGNSHHLLSRMTATASRSHPIHTTIIGFGFDLDTTLLSSLSSVPLCNFFSVHSASEFLHQMTWEFDYLVFPIVENLVVSVVGKEGEGEREGEEKGVWVEKVCGSPESLEGYPRGTVMVCSGLFASQTQGKGGEGGTKGGVVVVKLRGVKEGEKVKLRTKFVTHEKEVVEVENEVVFPKWEEGKGGEREKWGSFGGEGVRKGVLVCRYVEFMKRFLEDVQKVKNVPTISKESGVVWKAKEEEEKEEAFEGGQKVGKETEVGCLGEYRERMKEFLEYFEGEASGLDDTELGVWKGKMEQLLPPEGEGEEVGGVVI